MNRTRIALPGTTTGTIFGRLGLRRSALSVFFGFLALFTQVSQAQTTFGSLKLFKNYFISGDYAVGGVGLRGQGVLDTTTQAIVGGNTTLDHYATGTIPM